MLLLLLASLTIPFLDHPAPVAAASSVMVASAFYCAPAFFPHSSIAYRALFSPVISRRAHSLLQPFFVTLSLSSNSCRGLLPSANISSNSSPRLLAAASISSAPPREHFPVQWHCRLKTMSCLMLHNDRAGTEVRPELTHYALF